MKAFVIFNLNLIASLYTSKQPIPDNIVSNIFKIYDILKHSWPP